MDAVEEGEKFLGVGKEDAEDRIRWRLMSGCGDLPSREEPSREDLFTPSKHDECWSHREQGVRVCLCVWVRLYPSILTSPPVQCLYTLEGTIESHPASVHAIYIKRWTWTRHTHLSGWIFRVLVCMCACLCVRPTPCNPWAFLQASKRSRQFRRRSASGRWGQWRSVLQAVGKRQETKLPLGEAINRAFTGELVTSIEESQKAMSQTLYICTKALALCINSFFFFFFTLWVEYFIPHENTQMVCVCVLCQRISSRCCSDCFCATLCVLCDWTKITTSGRAAWHSATASLLTLVIS